jgi:hypothetical protein
MAITLSCTLLNAHFYLFYPIVNHLPGKCDPANPTNPANPANLANPGNQNKTAPGNLKHPGNPDPRNLVS